MVVSHNGFVLNRMLVQDIYLGKSNRYSAVCNFKRKNKIPTVLIQLPLIWQLKYFLQIMKFFLGIKTSPRELLGPPTRNQKTSFFFQPVKHVNNSTLTSKETSNI